MERASFTERMFVDYSIVKKIGYNPYYPEIQSALDDPLVIDGKPYIDLASNNYLGLANDPRLCKAAKAAIDKYGISMCGTPIASGYSDLFRKVEILLSDFLGLEKTLIYPSCYQANNGIFTAIMKDDDIALVDRSAHSSLLEGIKATGCKIRPFLHNNLDHLETQ
ncbi:MAG: pyridoxal phosphate-dependent aminotransferase family protein, partial [Bacteroidales bacterium]|nr:pyridoxal phosphate-dependent aminotransferase family protein [Bacteroidales bacterium]